MKGIWRFLYAIHIDCAIIMKKGKTFVEFFSELGYNVNKANLLCFVETF